MWTRRKADYTPPTAGVKMRGAVSPYAVVAKYFEDQDNYKCCPYRAVNTLRLCYTNQSVNAV